MVAIIDYDAGNVRSLQFALERLRVNSVLTADPEVIKAADKVIFPGQGAAASAMKKLQQTGLDQLIPQLKQPVLGICLGMQLLCDTTEEGGVNGLGIIPGKVVRFSNKVKVPQMGWNTITNLQSPLFKHIKEDDFMYLVHSYYVPLLEATIAQSNYDGPYSVALQKTISMAYSFTQRKAVKPGVNFYKTF